MNSTSKMGRDVSKTRSRRPMDTSRRPNRKLFRLSVIGLVAVAFIATNMVLREEKNAVASPGDRRATGRRT